MMLSGPDPMCNGPCSLRLFGQLSLVPGPHSEPHEVFDELGYLYIYTSSDAYPRAEDTGA